MTPQFVKDWRNLPGNKNKTAPVRVKFYSHSPSPLYWRLNHHKFILIDYNTEGSDTILLAGSYNISKNAEHKQFDNMVVYKSNQYKDLYSEFKGEFERLWSLNRTRTDKPGKKFLDQFLVPQKGSYRIHAKQAVSLTFKEIARLRSRVNEKAKGIFAQLFSKKNCLYYNPDKAIYLGCPTK